MVYPVRVPSSPYPVGPLIKFLSLLVAWVVFLDTFHTAAATYMLWEFVVPNFGKPEIFVHLPWSVS